MLSDHPLFCDHNIEASWAMEPLRRNTVVEEITRKHKESKNKKNWFNMYNQIQVYCVSVSAKTKHNRLIAQGTTKNGNYDITKDTKCNKHNWKEKAHKASEKRVNLLSMHKTTRAAKLYYNGPIGVTKLTKHRFSNCKEIQWIS